MGSYSKACSTSVENMAIERQISGEMTINKITTEITTRIKGNPASTDNATTVER